MAQHLTELDINEVSLVDRPANSEIDPKTGNKVARARVALFKRDDVEKYSHNQGRELGKFKAGEGVGKDQHAAEMASTAAQHESAVQHHNNRALDPENSPQGMKAHELAALAHYRASTETSTANSRTARYLSQAAGHLSKKITKEDVDVDMNKADGKTEDGKIFPSSDYAYVPDQESPSTWKLRLTSSPGGDPDPHIVGAAVAALGKGFRGNRVEIPSDALAGVKSKVRTAWHKANPDKGGSELPDVLKKGDDVTLEEIEKSLVDQNEKIEKQDAALKSLQAENEILKQENDLVVKMSKEERKAFGGMTSDKRKEYMMADTEKRKSMMAACEKKAKPFDDSAEDGEPEPDEDDMEKEKAKKNEELVKVEEQVAKVDGKIDEAVKKLEAQHAEELKKRDEQIAKHEVELDIVRKRERLVTFTKRAEDELPNTSGTPVEKGTNLMALADKFGEDSEVFKYWLELAKSADALISKHSFTEVGKWGGGERNASKTIDARVEEISKRDGVSKVVAYRKALEENPELYHQYEREKTGA